MYRETVQTSIKTGLKIVLDFLFPIEASVRKIELMSSDDLLLQLPASESIDALFSYADEKVKHLVWEIKYYRNQKITNAVGALIAEKIRGTMTKATVATATIATQTFFLVPIPLTRKRLHERGYNHTELLTCAICANLPEQFTLAPDFLKKVRHTPKQHSIENREDRFTNIAGAFEVPLSERERVANAHILIIDDVITTGATVAEAKRALLAAGAASVHVFAVAH